MAAGRLVLLLGAGVLAGAAFAAMTTGVMQPYRDLQNAAAQRASLSADGPDSYSQEQPQDYAASLFGSLGWPGRDRGDEATYPSGVDAYAHEEQQFHYDYAERFPDDEGDYAYQSPGGGDMGDYSDDAQGPYSDSLSPQFSREGDRIAPRRSIDAAADSASRAAAAAQDVLAAERAE